MIGKIFDFYSVSLEIDELCMTFIELLLDDLNILELFDLYSIILNKMYWKTN